MSRFALLVAASVFFAANAHAAPLADEPVKPLPQKVEFDAKKAELGKKLFLDTRLSKDNTLSCASCHDLKKGGTDQLPVSVGVGGVKGPINSPTVYNSAHNFVQFWDGRAKDLPAQAKGPVENPKEMAESWPEVEKKLKDDKGYVAAFKESYGGEITADRVADAIAEFERTLITPDSRFDAYLRGDEKALTVQEKRGYTLFKDLGCITCHSGDYLGGESYQVMNPQYFADRGNLTDADNGRFNVTKDEADKHAFKAPMLRNVEVTAPYFHDAHAKSLEDAVRMMAKYQLGQDKLPPADVRALTAFLKSLTGKYEGKYLNQMN